MERGELERMGDSLGPGDIVKLWRKLLQISVNLEQLDVPGKILWSKRDCQPGKVWTRGNLQAGLVAVNFEDCTDPGS